MRLMKPALRRIVAISTLLACRVAFAEEKAACLDSHARAQVLRKHGSLRAARKALATCADASCPSLVARDCTKWIGEVESEQPTVVVAARDRNGVATGAVRVFVDGEPLVASLD